MLRFEARSLGGLGRFDAVRVITTFALPFRQYLADLYRSLVQRGPRRRSGRVARPQRLRQFHLEAIEERITPSILSGVPDYSDLPTVQFSSYTEEGIDGRLTVPEVFLGTGTVDGIEFTLPEIPGWGYTDTVGQAMLPVFRTSLAIPANVEMTASYELLASTSMGEGHLVYPAQPLAPDLAFDDGVYAPTPEFAFDEAYYTDEVTSDTAVFWVSAPMLAGDECSVAIEFSPFDYDPLSGALSLVTALDFSLSFEESPAAGAAALPLPDLVSAAAQADYLIITADAFHDEVLPLAQWKQEKGFRTYVADMSEVGTTYTDVYDYIKAVYDADADKPEYVLLVGDHENVPSYEVVGHPYHGATHVWHSDYDYALLAGGDYLADLAVGRLPGDTEVQITTMVNKILGYERTPDTGSWYDDVLIAGMFQDSDDSNLIADRWFMEDLHRISDFLGGDYDFWSGADPYNKGFTIHTNRVWDASTSSTLHYQSAFYPGRVTPPDPVPDAWKFKADESISGTINNGASLVLHRDHGFSGGSGWADPYFVTSNVNALANGDKLPVVFSLNCATGWFDTMDNFAEAWMRNASGGAVAFTGAMRISYSGPNDTLHVGIFDAMWSDYETTWDSTNYEHSWRFGDVMNYAKDAVFAGYGYSSSYALLTARLFNVLGDPEMMIRTAVPGSLSVTHPVGVTTGAAADFTVQVTKGGVPLADALVAISKEGCSDYWVGQTDGTGQVTFTGLTATEAGTYDVVVSEQNATPYEGSFESVAAAGSDLLGTSLTVSPSNLLLAAGTTTVDFALQNAGDTATGAFDVQFYLSEDATIDPGVDLLLQLDPSDSQYDSSEPEAFHVAGLAGLAAYSNSVTLAVPTADPFGADGDYYLGMFVDADGNVTEVNETNNRNRGQGQDGGDVQYTIGPLDHFVWDAIASAQAVGAPFTATVTAKDSVGLTVTTFTDTVSLTGRASDGVTSVSVTPTGCSFVNGVWTGSVTVQEQVADMYLRVDDGSGHYGDSGSFAVQSSSFALSGPSSGSYAEGDVVTIQWTASGVVPGSTISLCYDEDTTWWNGNEHWIEVDQVAAANGNGSYNWNTSGVQAGTYYLAGYLYAPGVSTSFSHLTQAFEITGSPSQSFVLTAPTSGSYTAGEVVSIQWTAGGVGSGSTISLCYDEDTTWWNGNEHWIEIDQVTAANGDDSYNWDTAGVSAGTYYIAGYLYVPGGASIFSHLAQAIQIETAVEQSFVLTGPTSGTFTAGEVVSIQWTAAGIASGGTISLCYDEDTTWWNGNEHWIEIDQVTAANGDHSYDWNTADVSEGTYYVAGYLYVSGGASSFSHLTQAIQIQNSAEQTFTLTGPTSGSYTVGDVVSIQWTAGGVLSDTTISLCYDEDTTWWNGNEHWIEIDQVAAANGSHGYNWDTSGVSAGTYYVAGYMYRSGGASTFSHLTQSIQIQGSAEQSFALTGPTSGNFAVKDIVSIQWTAGGVVAGSRISLCYDEDTTWWNGNEHWIEVDQVVAANGDHTYNWDTTGVASGTYYLAGYMYDFVATSIFSHLTDAISIGSELALAGGETADSDADALSETDLQAVSSQAIAGWNHAVSLSTISPAQLASHGVPEPSASSLDNQLRMLRSVSFVITDLAGSQLALAVGDTVYVDANAAGQGWFIDNTPDINEEYQAIGGELVTLDAKAVDRVDLLTVLYHELGHVLGLADLAPSAGTLMGGQLSPGLRREPTATEIDALWACSG